MLDLSILIVNYNTKDLLRACLKSIEKQVHVSHEVIVVDNASSDSSAEVLPDEFPNVHFILSPDNLGFAKDYLGIVAFGMTFQTLSMILNNINFY